MSKLMLFGIAPVDAFGLEKLGLEPSIASQLPLIVGVGNGKSDAEMLFLIRGSDPELLLDVKLAVLNRPTVSPTDTIQLSNS